MAEHGFTLVFREAPARGAQMMGAGQAAWASRLGAEAVYPPTRGAMALGKSGPRRRNLYTAVVGDFAQATEVLERMQADGLDCYIAPQRGVLGAAADPIADQATWWAQIRAPQAQAAGRWPASTPVRVAMLDSGVDTSHPQLANVRLNKAPDAPAGDDAMGHGTHVAGLIAATVHGTGNGCEGVANGCVELTVYLGIVLPHRPGLYYRALAEAIDSAPQILNLSVGGEGIDQEEAELVREALAAGIIVVAAAGNDADLGSPNVFPAALEDVIAVAAVDPQGQRASFSNESSYLRIAAPGVDIVSTITSAPMPGILPFGSPPLASCSGTSMAAPIVTGVIARMLSYKPGLTAAQVTGLLVTCHPGPWNDQVGLGVINAEALLAAL